MKFYYVAVCLTFLLSFQRTSSQPNPAEFSSSEETLSLSEAEVSVCTTKECRRSAQMLRKNLKKWIHPCHDFYEFACGSFFGKHVIWEASYKRVYELNDKILGFLKSNDDRKIQAIAKIQHIFRLCTDIDSIEEFGYKVIQLQLDNVKLHYISPFHQQTNILHNFGQILAKVHRNAAIPFLFSLHVGKDTKDYRINRLFIQLDSSTVTYTADERFTQEQLDYEQLEEYFIKYMIEVVEHLYQMENMEIFKEILEFLSHRADKVVQFLLNAEKVVQDNKNFPPNYEHITMQELQEKTDKILENTNIEFNWLEYLSTLFENTNIYRVEKYFVSGEPLIVNNMKYIESIFEVISSIDEDVFKASLLWIIVNDVIHIASKQLRTLQNQFLKNTLGFTNSRKNICLKFAKDRFSHALTHLLLLELGPDAKRCEYEITDMNENIRNSFLEVVENSSWLDESTKEEARNKVEKIKTFISHESWVEKPQKIENKYAAVTVEHSWYETRLKENVRTVEEKLKLLLVKNKSNEKLFPIDPLEINTVYNYVENTIGIPFGILGLPYFGHGLHSMDYGGIGSYLGYSFALAFSEIGRKIDSSGNKRNWWSKTSLQKYNERANCFVDFYSKFKFHGTEIELDGNLTLDSNIADNIGIKLALSAYEKYVQKNGAEEKLIGFETYTSEQLLTLAMANTMCVSIPKNYYDKKAEKEIHSPHKLRVNGMFMNSDKIADIWNCPKKIR